MVLARSLDSHERSFNPGNCGLSILKFMKVLQHTRKERNLFFKQFGPDDCLLIVSCVLLYSFSTLFCFSDLSVEKVKVSVCKGDITNEPVDVIVNAANGELLHSMGGVCPGLFSPKEGKQSRKSHALS